MGQTSRAAEDIPPEVSCLYSVMNRLSAVELPEAREDIDNLVWRCEGCADSDGPRLTTETSSGPARTQLGPALACRKILRHNHNIHDITGTELNMG
jgi:hypothetical protein